MWLRIWLRISHDGRPTMAMGGGGSTYKSADGIWHAAIDIEPDRATGRRRRLTAQGKTKAVANCLCSMVLRPVERLVFSPKER